MSLCWPSIWLALTLYRSSLPYPGSSPCFHVDEALDHVKLSLMVTVPSLSFRRCLSAAQDSALVGQTDAGRQLVSAFHWHRHTEAA